MSRLNPAAPLTKRQQEIRDHYHRLHREYGRHPSRVELARSLGRPDGGYLSRVVEKLKTRGERPR